MEKNAWGEKSVILKLSKSFIENKVKVYANGVWVVLFLDCIGGEGGLSRCKNISGDNNVIICFLTTDMKDSVQSVDALLGRYICVAIVN